MNPNDTLRGVNSNVQTLTKAFLFAALLSIVGLFAACGDQAGGPAVNNETAATVNGKAITMEEIERALKQQSQGQEGRLSQLELAGARLQILQTLIEQEVMFQKAEKEGTVPSEEEVTTELNRQKTQSGRSADQIAKDMETAGVTEAIVRDQIKRQLAIQKLTDKITGKIEPPKETEIDAFYNGNKEAFVKKKGVKLAAIVIDPANSGEGDTTTDDVSAVARGNEIINQLRTGADFAAVAREKSEDPSRFQGGDLGYIAEEQLRTMLPAQTVQALMNPQTPIGQIFTSPIQGRYYILKLQERSDRDEALTLESPGVREQVTNSLINARKQLLAASYQAIAMNEAKIENLLAKKVVENPNELSGARPASPNTPAANTGANTNAPANANTGAPTANANVGASNANAAANRPAANANAARPATNAAANANR
jgi:parvulin-like peptidyl-prolyl isomerase